MYDYSRSVCYLTRIIQYHTTPHGRFHETLIFKQF